MSVKEYDSLFQKGVKALKTSFFSLKFSPNYVEAESKFTAAAKGYLKICEYPKSIDAFKRAVDCQNHLDDPLSAANSYVEIAKIYFFNLKVFDLGVQNLKSATQLFLMSNKFSCAIKQFTDLANTFIEEQNLASAESILKEAFKTCAENIEDNMISSNFEPIFSKLLDIECGMKKWHESIEMTQKYIENQKKFADKNNYRINKNYMKLGLLRIINNESYLIEDIIQNMYQNSYDGTSEDSADLRKCLNAIETLNKKTSKETINKLT